MKIPALILMVLLAGPASANSLELALCKEARGAVDAMQMSEKLCRSFARALVLVPHMANDQVRAMLTPENLQVMASVTSLWLSTQGIPVVGEVVDLGIVTLGIHLMAEQTKEVAQALIRYAELTHAARNDATLNEAAAHLAKAVATAGVNLVAFVLTHRVAMKATKLGSGGPPAQQGGMVMAGGQVARAIPVSSEAAARYKQDGNAVPEGRDVDHTQDLQLGGADDVLNMSPLDSSVNRSIGAQIMHQIKELADGARIDSITIGD